MDGCNDCREKGSMIHKPWLNEDKTWQHTFLFHPLVA